MVTGETMVQLTAGKDVEAQKQMLIMGSIDLFDQEISPLNLDSNTPLSQISAYATDRTRRTHTIIK